MKALSEKKERELNITEEEKVQSMKSPLFNSLLVVLQLQFVIVSLADDDQQIEKRSKCLNVFQF